MARFSLKILLVVAAGFLVLPQSLRAGGWRGLSPEASEALLGSSVAQYVAAGERMLAARGDGGGAAVANLIVAQMTYKDTSSLIALLWIWENPSPNPAGILFFVNGDPVLDEFGLEPLVKPGDTTWLVSVSDANATPGSLSCQVQGGGKFASDDQRLKDSQPFEDPKVTCTGGPYDSETKLCSLELSIENSGTPKPTYYSLGTEEKDLLNQDIPGTSTEFSLPGYESGEQCVTLTGWLLESGNYYLGQPVESCCTLDCSEDICLPPSNVESCQNSFGPDAGDNHIGFSWQGGMDYEEILVSLDGEALDSLEGTATELSFDDLEPGEHELVLQGKCGGDLDPSDPVTVGFTLLAEKPDGEAPANLSCKFTASDYSLATLTWKNNDVAAYHEVYIIDAEGAQRLGLSVAGKATGANLEGTAKGDSLGVRSFYERDGYCFGSELVTCEPTRPPGFKYLAGDCDGNSNLDLTDAIFGLNLLFKGGESSPCEAACDANKDEKFDLADSIYTLNHLFLGGPPPGGNYPGCDEGYPDDYPSCPKTTCNRE